MEALNKEIAEMTTQLEKLKSEREEQATKLSSQDVKLDSEIGSLTKERAQFTSKGRSSHSRSIRPCPRRKSGSGDRSRDRWTL